MDILNSITPSKTSNNPFYRAMNQETVTDINVASAGKLGSLLRRKKIVTGDGASIIDATLDFFLGDKEQTSKDIPANLAHYNYTKNFVPIIIRTEFNYNELGSKPLYIVFESTPEDSISISKQANWNAVDFPGRPEPVQVYANSSAVTLSLKGTFFVNEAAEHGLKMKLADYIHSLAYPSKIHYMPSPVTVFIGEWKKFRAIVNSVQIDYKGPWHIRGAELAKLNDPKAMTGDPNEVAAYRKQYGDAVRSSDNFKIASHAPYIFEATFSLTLVNDENKVNYAEDIIRTAGNTYIAENKALDWNTIVRQGKISKDGATVITGRYSVTGNTTYKCENGTITSTSNMTTSAQTINYADYGNQQRRAGDLAVITNSVNNQITKALKKLF